MNNREMDRARDYLLFSELNFDFRNQLPLELGNGVELANPDTAYFAIDHCENHLANRLNCSGGSRVTALLTPERFVGSGECSVCLSKARAPNIDLESSRDDLFTALLALRLVKPIAFDLRATVTVSNGEISNEGRYLDQSGFNPVSAREFGAKEVAQAKAVNSRLIQLKKARRCRRSRSALTNFAQITLGFVGSWQLAMLGLFAALEGFFPHPGRKAEKASGISRFDELHYGSRLARRVATFLSGPLLRKGDEMWLQKLYTERRNGLAHGSDFYVQPKRNPESSQAQNDFARLHELARLCALGMLGYRNADLNALLPEDADELIVQQKLSAIAGSARFLKGQRRWD